jgi:hypothetical protein
MGISARQLVERYPVLYHMASADAWESVQEHGLLSTSALLDLFEVPEPRRSLLLTTQRTKSEPLTHARYGTAILRDQKPLSQKNLDRCLTDCAPAIWYQTLNERVFFWLNRDRLITLMSAAEYFGKPHTVLELDSSGLVNQYVDRIELAHMNTGNTRPFAHPRGLSTFQNLANYPYESRERLADYSAVVELTVLSGVPNVRDHVRKVELAKVTDKGYRPLDTLFSR